MQRALLFSLLAVLTQFNVLGQCTTNHATDLIISSNTILSGVHNVNGTFRVLSGVTVTVDASCNGSLEINASEIDILGTIDASGSGGSGGSGGIGGGFATCDPNAGGGGGFGGSFGAGDGGGGTAGDATQGTHLDLICGGLFCIGNQNGLNAGGGGGGGGGGGSYGGLGGKGALGADGAFFSSTTGGVGGIPGATTFTFGTATGFDISIGSGGGGAGGGGGGWSNGFPGSPGGNGGGAITLNSTGDLTVTGGVYSNGINGGNGGNGAGISTDGSYGCTSSGYSGCSICSEECFDAAGGGGGGGGAGSGGGILIIVGQTATITGILEARGGNGGTAGSPNSSNGTCFSGARGGGGGGGGRIKVVRNPCYTHSLTPLVNVGGGAGGIGDLTGFTGLSGSYNEIDAENFTPLTPGIISTSSALVSCGPTDIDTIFMDTLFGGAGAYQYQWQLSLNNGVTFSDIAGATQPFYAPPSIAQTSVYRLEVTSAACIDYSTQLTVTILPGVTNNGINSNQFFCGAADPALLSGSGPVGGNGTFNIQWQSSVDSGMTWTNIMGANGQDYDPGVTSVTSHFRRVVTSGPCSDTSNTVIVDITEPIANNVIAANQTKCSTVRPDSILGSMPTGGIGSYEFQWQVFNGGTWVDIPADTGLHYHPPILSMTTNYRRQIISGICTLHSNIITITVLPSPSILSINPTDPGCTGDSTGFITISAAGSNGNLSYSGDSASTFQNSNIITGLPDGTYYVAVMDDSGCVTISSAVVLTDPPLLDVSATSIDASCEGVFDGELSALGSGGTPSYQYSLNGGPIQPSGNFNALSDGHYVVTVFDANGCTDTTSVQIDNEYEVVLTIDSIRNATCFGGMNGAIWLNADSGVSPYLFSNGGITYQPSSMFDSLGAGSYNLFVQDSRGCNVGIVAAVSEPADMVIGTDSIFHVGCFGDSTGAIYANVTGGTPAHAYMWSTGDTTSSVQQVSQGSYQVSVTDVNGCTATSSFLISESDQLHVDLASIDSVSCSGASDGRIDISVTGGTVPYTFNWSNGATSEDIISVSGGTYEVTVMDAAGCTEMRTYQIYEPTPLSAITMDTDVLCFGDQTGSIAITASGGSGGYTYLWSNFQTSATAMSLSAGNYFAVITDENGCQLLVSDTIDEPSELQLAVGGEDISCFGVNDGWAGATTSGGVTPYQYLWSNSQTTDSIFGLAPGSYGVTVTDTNGCSTTSAVVVGQKDSMELAFFLTEPLCFADSTGSIDLSVSGGTSPYQYSWSNGMVTEDITNIPAGNYHVTVTDDNGCVVSSGTVLDEPSVINVSVDITDVSCFGGNDGEIDLTVNGATPAYSFNWSNSATTEDIANLSAGTYMGTVQDANGCEITGSFIVNEPPLLQVNMTLTDPSCSNVSDGSASATANGGTPGYTYLWSNFDTGQVVSGLSAGNIGIQVTDDKGCTAQASGVLSNPDEILISGIITDVSCNGDATGAIDVTVTNGVGNLSYSWSNAAVTEDLSSEPAGMYTLTVTDSAGCSSMETFAIDEPTALIAGLSTSEVSCNGGSDGLAITNVSGGVGPYGFNWSNYPNNTGSVLNGLESGWVEVVVSDGNGCQVILGDTITEPGAIEVTTNVANTNCFNSQDGAVFIDASGGDWPYTYIVDGVVSADSIATNLLPGNHTVTVQDSRGCVSSVGFTINSDNDVQVELQAASRTIIRGESIELIANSTSVSAIVAHHWTPQSEVDVSGCLTADNCHNPTVSPEDDQIFWVTVVNADSCAASDSVFITVRQDYATFFPTAFTPNRDGLNERFDFEILGSQNVEVTVFNRWGEQVYYNENQLPGLGHGWDGMIDGKLAPEGGYVYQIVVTFFDGTEENYSGSITLIR